MMEAAATTETSIYFYETTWRNIQNLHTRRRENLKSHLRYGSYDLMSLTLCGIKMMAERAE
jgi:hypothetical protein